jgi:hypothetical protein
MSTSVASTSHAAIASQASLREVDAELRRRGTLQYSHEYVKDLHFQRYVLQPQLSTVAEVEAFLQKLDDDRKARKFSASFDWCCSKVSSARQSLAYVTSQGNDLDWALRSLARARRTNCSCHETGSFHPQ